MQNRHSVAVCFHFSNNITGPEGAGDAVEDFSSDEERDTTDAETDAEAEAEES